MSRKRIEAADIPELRDYCRTAPEQVVFTANALWQLKNQIIRTALYAVDQWAWWRGAAYVMLGLFAAITTAHIVHLYRFHP
jgi:membrane protein YdbS with pleckstrin-like domain